MSHAFASPPSTTKPLPKPADAAWCAATGCLRWSRKWGPNARFLCAFHWRRLTKRERATMRRLWRLLDRIGEGWHSDRRLRARVWRTWRALVRRAGSA